MADSKLDKSYDFITFITAFILIILLKYKYILVKINFII